MKSTLSSSIRKKSVGFARNQAMTIRMMLASFPGPFPVNYDTRNWNHLAEFLQTEERTKIPVYTRAKLLHDAWNLAYAGDLSFATALNMTLFLKNEREYLAWDPVFTLIDHIGKHIDSSAVHQKFQVSSVGFHNRPRLAGVISDIRKNFAHSSLRRTWRRAAAWRV